MEKLYFVFDYIPSSGWGGFFSAYQQLINLLKDEYEIHIISIFKGDKDVEKSYPGCCIHTIIDQNIDIRFYRLIQHLKNKKIGAFFKSFYSLFVYFISIPYCRNKVKKIIKEDKVIVSSPSSAIFMPKIPFILEIHTKYEYFFGENKIGRMQSKMMSKPSLILFRTKYDALKMKEIPSDCMYNFFDHHDVKPFIFNYDKRKNKILFLGRLSKEKNPYRLLDIAELLKKEIPDIQIDIFGNGVLEEKIRSEIQKRNLNDFVFMKGFINDKSIYADYSFLINTSDTEGFPLTIIEAKANGVPTISSFWGEGVYECITHGVDGFIVNENEEYVTYLKNYLNDEQKLLEMSQNASLDFVRFSCDKAKENWKHILESYRGYYGK